MPFLTLQHNDNCRFVTFQTRFHEKFFNNFITFHFSNHILKLRILCLLFVLKRRARSSRSAPASGHDSQFCNVNKNVNKTQISFCKLWKMTNLFVKITFFIWSGDTEAPKAVKAETWVSLDSVLARKSLV